MTEWLSGGLLIAGATLALLASIGVLRMPDVFTRSRIDAVGSPAFQKNASILPSLIASTDWATPRLCARMSRWGSRPAA